MTTVGTPKTAAEFEAYVFETEQRYREIERDRDRAVEELRVAQGLLFRFEALLDASSDFIAVAALDGAMVYLNPGGRAMVGLEPDTDITQTSLFDYAVADSMPSVDHPALMEHGEWTGESSLRDHRGGPPIPVTVSSFLMIDPVTKEPFAIATVQRDIAERIAVEATLRKVAVDRHDLLHRLVVAQEAERAGIAADVHDDSVQALAAVDLRLGLLRRRLAEAMPESGALIEQLQVTVSRATDRLRQLLFDLEPAAAGASLINGLRDVAAHILEDGVVKWTLTADDSVDRLAYAERVEAIRIAKEALANARQHANASEVAVRVQSSETGVEIAITDNGVGVDPDSVKSRPGHRGLATMRDRADIAGGWWRLEGVPGGGTTVRFWLPSVREGLDR